MNYYYCLFTREFFSYPRYVIRFPFWVHYFLHAVSEIELQPFACNRIQFPYSITSQIKKRSFTFNDLLHFIIFFFLTFIFIKFLITFYPSERFGVDYFQNFNWINDELATFEGIDDQNQYSDEF